MTEQRKRPPKDVLDVCTEIEDAGGGGACHDAVLYAAGEILALRGLVRQAQALVGNDTVEAQRWHSEAARRLNRRTR
jgi:hypothetical protein